MSEAIHDIGTIVSWFAILFLFWRVRRLEEDTHRHRSFDERAAAGELTVDVPEDSVSQPGIIDETIRLPHERDADTGLPRYLATEHIAAHRETFEALAGAGYPPGPPPGFAWSAEEHPVEVSWRLQQAATGTGYLATCADCGNNFAPDALVDGRCENCR